MSEGSLLISTYNSSRSFLRPCPAPTAHIGCGRLLVDVEGQKSEVVEREEVSFGELGFGQDFRDQTASCRRLLKTSVGFDSARGNLRAITAFLRIQPALE